MQDVRFSATDDAPAEPWYEHDAPDASSVAVADRVLPLCVTCMVPVPVRPTSDWKVLARHSPPVTLVNVPVTAHTPATCATCWDGLVGELPPPQLIAATATARTPNERLSMEAPPLEHSSY